MTQQDTSPSGTDVTAEAGDLTTQAKQVGTKAASDASDVAHDAASRATTLAHEVGGRVTSSAEDGKNAVATQIDDMAKAVHRAGEQLEGHQDFLAKLVERGADELGGLAATLRSNDLQGLSTKLQTLARQQPALFVGAALAAGFAAVRFGKVAASGATQANLPHVPENLHGQ